LGRQLDPDLDLWKTAKPYLENWMQEQIGWRGLIARFKEEATHYNKIIPELPRLLHQALTVQSEQPQQNAELLKQLVAEQKRTNLFLGFAVYFGGGLIGGIIVAQLLLRWYRLVHWW
jgi:ubiquinone biosynthesis protein